MYSKQQAMFANASSKMPVRITGTTIQACTAYGAKGDILVLQLRRDHITTIANGKIHDEPVGAFFRVSPKTWMLEEWLDAPINPQAAAPPGGPPGGGPPAGGPPPGGPGQ